MHADKAVAAVYRGVDVETAAVIHNLEFQFALAVADANVGAPGARLAWAAIVIAILAFTPVGFFAFLLSIPWVLVTSIVLLRGRPGGAVTN